MRSLGSYLAEMRRACRRVDWKIALKLGITATLALIVVTGLATLVGHHDKIVAGMWGVVASLYVIQAHLGGSYRAARTRILGIFTGSATGALFTELFGAENFALGFSVTCNVVLCYILNLKDSLYISSMSLVVVNILWKLNPSISPWEFSFFRMVDSAAGIGVALLVAHYIWPSHASTKLRTSISKSLLTLSDLYRVVSDPSIAVVKRELACAKLVSDYYALQRKNQNYLEEALLETMSGDGEREGLTELVSELDEIFQSIVVLRPIYKTQFSKIFDDQLLAGLNKLRAETILTFQQLAPELEGGLSILPKPSIALKKALALLNAELARFRQTRSTRQFDLSDVEGFFFFIYSIKSLVQDLKRLEKTILSVAY